MDLWASRFILTLIQGHFSKVNVTVQTAQILGSCSHFISFQEILLPGTCIFFPVDDCSAFIRCTLAAFCKASTQARKTVKFIFSKYVMDFQPTY